MTENGVVSMTRKPETAIKFSRNWGGKLDMARFTTVRGQDKLYKEGEIYPIILASGLWHEKKEFGPARLLKIEFKRIEDFNIAEILADIGRRTSGQPRSFFFHLLEDYYKHKSWWDGMYSVVQKLTLEYIGRNGLHGSG